MYNIKLSLLSVLSVRWTLLRMEEEETGWGGEHSGCHVTWQAAKQRQDDPWHCPESRRGAKPLGRTPATGWDHRPEGPLGPNQLQRRQTRVAWGQQARSARDDHTGFSYAHSPSVLHNRGRPPGHPWLTMQWVNDGDVEFALHRELVYFTNYRLC